jgi:hypothetical protein
MGFLYGAIFGTLIFSGKGKIVRRLALSTTLFFGGGAFSLYRVIIIKARVLTESLIHSSLFLKKTHPSFL